MKYKNWIDGGCNEYIFSLQSKNYTIWPIILIYDNIPPWIVVHK